MELLIRLLNKSFKFVKIQQKIKNKISTKTKVLILISVLIIATPLIYFAFMPPNFCSFRTRLYNNGPVPIGSNSSSYYCRLGVGPRIFYTKFSNNIVTGIIDQQVANTTLITMTANSISNGNGTVKDKAQKIMDWLHSNNGLVSGNCGGADSRGRTAHEIISSKCSTGCTDWTLAFVALARAKGISATVTETVSDRWVIESQRAGCLKLPKEGHFFSEIYTGIRSNNGWEIADPTFGGFTTIRNGFVLLRSPGDCFGCGIYHRFFRRGLSSWDYGLLNDTDFTNAAKNDIGVNRVCN